MFTLRWISDEELEVVSIDKYPSCPKFVVGFEESTYASSIKLEFSKVKSSFVRDRVAVPSLLLVMEYDGNMKLPVDHSDNLEVESKERYR